MNSLSDGLMKLEQIVQRPRWELSMPNSVWCAKTLIGTYCIHIDGGRHQAWLERYVNYRFEQWDGPERGYLEQAQSDAEAHYLETMSSVLNLDPILSEIKRMREALDELHAAVLPVDVPLPPGTVIRAGCKLPTLLTALRARGMVLLHLEAALSTLSPQEPDKDDLLALCEEKGLCATVPTEIYLAYEERAKAIAERDKRETPTAIKNAILALVLEARLSGMIDGRSSQDPTNDRK